MHIKQENTFRGVLNYYPQYLREEPNNILRLCGQTESWDTIENFFNLHKFKSTIKIIKNNLALVIPGFFYLNKPIS